MAQDRGAVSETSGISTEEITARYTRFSSRVFLNYLLVIFLSTLSAGSGLLILRGKSDSVFMVAILNFLAIAASIPLHRLAYEIYMRLFQNNALDIALRRQLHGLDLLRTINILFLHGKILYQAIHLRSPHYPRVVEHFATSFPLGCIAMVIFDVRIFLVPLNHDSLPVTLYCCALFVFAILMTGYSGLPFTFYYRFVRNGKVWKFRV